MLRIVQDFLPLFDSPVDPTWPKRLVSGLNEVEGVPVEVVRKRCRNVNIRICPNGTVRLTVPAGWSTIKLGEEFLKSKWTWVKKARAEVLSCPSVVRTPLTEEEITAFKALLGELNAVWSARVGEPNVAWKIRKVKSVWGCCHWKERYITYNADLARAPRELVEYVVVHEYTHFAVHGHGPKFYALMDERLPGWKVLRKRLNSRNWNTTDG